MALSSDGSAAAGNTVSVQTQRLDDLISSNVGFIKIDVEGHEAAVLRGAMRTMERDRPCVIIEAEDRHRSGATQEVILTFKQLEYAGFFFFKNKLLRIEDFTIDLHQSEIQVATRGGSYANNFVFVPKEKVKVVEFLEQ